jgi:hypothetical protein
MRMTVSGWDASLDRPRKVLDDGPLMAETVEHGRADDRLIYSDTSYD